MSVLVEMLSTPGCSKCARTRQALKEVAEAFEKQGVAWREINVLEEIDYAVALGVLVPPSIAIDGKLVFPALPSPERLREELLKRLGKSHGSR